MTNLEELEEEELRPTKYPALRVLTGGKGPPEPPSVNWLAELEAGTTFVARHRNSKDVDYNIYHVIFKSLPDVVLLGWRLPDGKVLDYYVEPERFSKQFDKYVILSVEKQLPTEVVEETTVEVEETNGNSNRTDRLSDVVLHEAMQGKHQLPEDTEQS